MRGLERSQKRNIVKGKKVENAVRMLVSTSILHSFPQFEAIRRTEVI